MPSASDRSNSAAGFGSTASGSSGFFMQLWQWIVFFALVCCCVGGSIGCVVLGSGKKRGAKKKPKTRALDDRAPTAPLRQDDYRISDPAPMPLTSPLTPMVYAQRVDNSYPAYSGSYPGPMDYAPPASAYPITDYIQTSGYPTSGYPTSSYSSPVPTSSYPVPSYSEPIPTTSYPMPTSYSSPMPSSYPTGSYPGGGYGASYPTTSYPANSYPATSSPYPGTSYPASPYY
jgi:hypothetical protein